MPARIRFRGCADRGGAIVGEEIGLGPKTVARLLRFQALLSRLRDRREPPSWADLALQCGYFDQSHLVRDVRRFTGLSPTALLLAAGGAQPARHPSKTEARQGRYRARHER